MSKLLKNLLIALVVIVVVWFGYRFYKQRSEQTVLTSSGAVSPEVERETIELKRTIDRLDNYTMNTGILSDPRFVSLENFRVDIADEPTGRTNPFAPVR